MIVKIPNLTPEVERRVKARIESAQRKINEISARDIRIENANDFLEIVENDGRGPDDVNYSITKLFDIVRDELSAASR